MSRFNTGNPIGSADPRDRDDNSKNLDEAVNDLNSETWIDRFGVERITIQGALNRFNDIVISGGQIFPSEEAGRAAVEDEQYYYSVSDNPDVSKVLWRRIDSGNSEFIADEPAAPLVFQNEKTGKGARYLIHGNLTKRVENPDGSYTISHGELLVLRGAGRGAVYIAAADDVVVPSTYAYYADLSDASSGDPIVAQVTEGNSNSTSNGIGAFVEDLQIPLLSVRSQGLTGILAERYDPLYEWPAVSLIWFPIGSGTRVIYDEVASTLSWSSTIVGINRMDSISRNALTIPAYTVNIPSGNYVVVWLDMRAVPAVGAGSIVPEEVIFAGSYQDDDPDAYRGLPYQVPLFISGSTGARPAPGFFEGTIEGIYYPADTEGLETRVTSLEDADALAREQPAVPLIWFPIGSGVIVDYDADTRTLSWSSRIIGINRMDSISRNVIALEAHSVVIPSNNYTVVWLDMSEIGEVGAGAIDVATAVKVGNYQGSDPDAYRGLPHQVPMFISGARGVRPAPGFFENDIRGVYYPADTSSIEAEVDDLDLRVAELETEEKSPVTTVGGRGGFPVYLDGGAIAKLGLDGAETLIDVSPDSFLREPQWKGEAILTATDKPSLTNTTPVFVSADGKVMHPSSPELMGVIIGHGQSNSRGNRGYIGDYIDISPRYADHALMFDGPGTGDNEMDVRLGLLPEDFDVPISPSVLEGFQPLRSVDKIGMGTTFMEGGAATLHTMLDQQLGYLADYLYYSAGRGGTALSGLEQGTVPFQNFVIALERAKVLAEQLGKRLWVPAIWWMQGESNTGTADYMQQLHDNVYQPMVTEIQRITGQLLTPKMFYMQPSSFGGTAAVRDMFNNAETYPSIKLVGASYPCPFSFDNLHQVRVGQFKIGEYMAKAAINECFGAADWRPMMPIATRLVNSTTVEIDFHIPEGQLTVDSEATAKDAYWGFEVFNEGSQVGLSGISSAGNTVTINSSVPLTEGEIAVRYALNGQSSPRSDEEVPRGLLRDSDPTISLADGSPLYNWCVHFEEPL